ncbi:filamin-A-like isoform X11 [Saccostrea echinata]|uniref:filamin-A-like isoform X11 n=1 Tax=Saccostrea echinata TaxID=191078 RepID=UPI002A80A599|nr:filamin-A-like isoform X11 [Saccostrea echinata]
MADSESHLLGDEEDEEMPLTERDLADDAQWKLIQKNTFTRWANEHLKTVNKVINNLETDFSDGLRLIALVEVLSGKKFKHVNKRPNFRTQKLENVTMVLEFLERDEGIRIVNIDSSDIVDSKIKLILGLIWTLILHYSISMPMWEGEEPTPSEGGPTPKQRLLNWVQSKIPDQPIKNFSTDWNDGRAIGALVDAVGPGLCPDWEDWNPKNAKKNAKEAMDNAEKWLDVPQLIKPEEITNPKVDEMSMMTYLAQFPKAKLKPGAPVRPRLNANRVRAYGPGLEPKGNQVGAPARFTVETFSAGKATLEVTVLNPKGKKETCEVVFNNDRNLTYSCVYVPSMEGEYKVIIKFGEKEINKSPFSVKVEGAAGDPTKVTASGPGLEKTGVIATKRTYFEVFTKNAVPAELLSDIDAVKIVVAPGKKDAGKGSIDVVILDPHGRKDTIRPSIAPVPGKEGTYLVEYIPMEQGVHSINIMFAGQQIPKSPYGVNVSPASNAKMCYATGRGIQPRGIRVNENAEFKVHTKGAGAAEVKIHIIGPGGIDVKCTSKKSTKEEGVYECVYVPLKQGQYIINITFGDQHIAKSPFKVDVGPAKTSKIRAYGPGLEGGVVNQPARFTVETMGETGALGFSIEGPSQAKIDCKDNSDGSADVTYYPTAQGEYAVHILCNEEDIPKSPYMVQIQPETKAFNASKVTAFGPGLEKSGVVQNKWTEFTVDAKKAGKAALNISCLDVDLKPIPVEIVDKKDGTFQCKYMPKKSCKHTITITWGGVQIPNSPFRVQVGEPSKPANVKVYGPGVEKGVKTHVSTYFIVDCTTAGPGDIGIALTDANGRDVPVKTTDQKDGTFKVEYEPVNPGTYVVAVYFAGKEIPSSPIKVPVEASIDLSKVKVVGLDKPMTVNKEREIQIITKAAGKSTASPRVTVTTPSKKKVELKDKPIPEGFQTFFTPTEVGSHKVEVTYGGKPVPKSPFTVDVLPDAASKVKAYGPGLKGGSANAPAEFTIDSRAATTPGELGVTIEGPKEAKIETKQNPDGTVGVTYYPEVPGEYKINVTYANSHIKDSPFKAKILPEEAANKVKCYGDGLTTGSEGQPAVFTVDTREAPKPEKKVDVKVKGPGPAKVDMKKKPDTTTEVTYTPTKPGDYSIDVTYDGKPVKDSPFKANIKPEDAANKVKAYGPGLTGGSANVNATFTVDSKEAPAPKQNVDVKVSGPAPVQPKLTKKPDGTVDVDYVATKPGDYSIDVTYGNKPIKDSPFKAKIVPDDSASKVIAYGPGLTNASANAPATFTVDTRRAPAQGQKVDVDVKGPAPVKPTLTPKADGTIDVAYTATAPGDYTIDVTYGEKSIKDSPFKAKVTKDVADSRVRAYGPGLEGGNAEQPCSFTIDSRRATVPGPVGVKVFGPKEAKIDMKSNPDGTFGATYMPTMPGDYTVEVTHNEKPLEESPFKVHIGPATGEPVDTTDSGVKAYGPGLKNAVTDKPAVFTVDARNAKYPGAIGVGIEGPKEATIDTKSNPDGTVAVTYFPTEQGEYTINVTYDDKPIKESPFKCRVRPSAGEKPLTEADLSGVKVYGPGLNPQGVFLDSPTEFTVDAKSVTPTGEGNVRAIVNNPSGVKNDTKVTNKGDGTYDVLYTPVEEGTIAMDVTYDNMAIPNSPFKVNAVPGCDASRVKAYGPGLEGGYTNQSQVFTIDIKGAGQGGLGLSIDGPSEVPINCKDNRDGTCTVEYMPSKPGDYDVSVKFADQEIPNSPFRVAVKNPVDAKKVKCYGPGIEPMGVKTGAPATFTVDTTEAGEAPLEVTCTDQRGRVQPAQLTPVAEGVVDATYYPVEEGPCKVDVKYANQHVPGSPFKFHVDAVNSGHVTAYGPGLCHGIVNEPAEFTIVTKDAGAGGLSLAIEGPSKTEIKCVDNGDGTCTVSYIPTAPGEYNITVKFADNHISGSPFTAKISPTAGEPRRKAQIGRSSEVSLKVMEQDINNLTASIRSPSGREEPCLLKRLANGHLGISFTPREVGEHLVNVFRNGQHINGSPFKIIVGESELGNASKVRVAGQGLQSGMANEINEFMVDTRDAGYGGLSLSIEGPSKADIECLDNEDGSCRVTYKPTEPGNYIINIKFSDEHVPGSPFNVNVGGEPSSRMTERITRHREAADITHIGSQCELSLKIPVAFFARCAQYQEETQIQTTTGTSPFDMTASVTSPSGVTELCDIVSLDDNHYSIKFVPKEMGVHTVSVKHKDMHIPGSPFEFTVGPITGGGSHKVHAAGPGLEKGEINQPCEFNIYTREAGAGGLSIAVEGPSKAELDFDDRKDGSCGVKYVVTEPGEYLVSVKFNDEHIPESPFKVYITPSIGDARKLSVAALQQKGLQVGKPAAFVVNFNGASKGKLRARVISPSGTEEEALIQEIDDGEYAVRFIPRENGVHNVFVTFDGCDIPDSPFRILVGKVDADPGMVTASGDGLRTGQTGQTCKFVVNTCNAGAGALAVTVEGPSKVKLECKEVDEGYEFTYSPTAPGDYMISIRYAGVNIAGSPFKAKIEGPGKPSGYHEQASVVVETVTKTSVMSKFSGLQKFQSDASRCTAEGMGLKKAFRGKQATFSVDTSQAGNNMMFVGMMGPKGPCEELCVKNQGGYVYKINYIVRERGDYMLVVKWGDQQIPGSPFCVHVD